MNVQKIQTVLGQHESPQRDSREHKKPKPKAEPSAAQPAAETTDSVQPSCGQMLDSAKVVALLSQPKAPDRSLIATFSRRKGREKSPVIDEKKLDKAA